MHNSSNSTAIKQQTLNDNIILDNLPPKIERTSQAVNKLQASRRADSWVSREQNVKLKMDLHDEEQTINKLQEKKSQDLNLLIGEVPFAHKNTRDNDSKSVSSKSSSPKIIVPDTDDDDDEDDAQDYGYDVKISTKEDNHRAQNPEISHQLWGKTQQNPFIASVDRSPSPSNKQNQSQSDGNSEVLNNILGTMSQNVDSAVQQRETTKQTKITMENNKNNKNQKIKEKIQVSAFNINSDQTSKQQNRKEEENDQNDYYLPKFPDKIEENQQQQSSKQYKGSLQKLHLQEDVEPEEMNFASTNWRQSTSPDAKLPLHRKQSEGDLEEEGEEEIEGEQLKHSGNRRSASPFKDYKDENISGGNPLGTKRQFQNNDPTESFYKEHNSMLDSSHNLHEFDTHHRQPLASKVGDIKINIESKNNMELSKHIGKDLLSGSTNILGKSKIIQSESLHTKGSVMSIAKPPANRLELEKKKEKQIQKFCQKFFKDQLKNRSGVPTLTQKKRTMVIESDTPNPDFHNQLEIKDDLLNDELRKELSNIEEHQKYRLVMDSFLKKFSRSPKEAIQFLIEKQLCDDTEEDIAFTLLTAEGLNKEQLGIFFGDSKEKNQGILEAFCSLMDFRDLRFDQAIRLFLSRFRLPGESQQIDRIVQKFTKVYARDNPNVFKENDEDTPYILCYASIMLNVDAHSEKIDKKQKMTKENFVKINLSCTRNAVTKEFLEELYDNIVKEEFQTKIDYIEKIYSRLPVDSMSQKYDGQTRKKISKALQAGSLCLKYGRKGKPHQRFVWLSQESDKIFWCEYGTPEQIIAAQQRKNSHYLNVNEIVDIALGSNTTAVMLKNKVPLEFDQYCFSLISQNRTLDLKCDNLDIKGRWIAFVYNLLNDLRLERKNARMLFKTTHPNNMERLSDVWRIDIFSKWEDHWDYAASKPKNLLNFEKKQTSLGCWECISAFCPFSKKKKTTAFNKSGSINSSNSNSNNNNARDREDSSSQGSNGKYGKYYEELEMPNHSDKSLLLISLWKIGMPPWVRKTIWPLTIGNRLEITQNLYNILLKQLQMLKSKQISQNPSKNNSIDIKRGQINQVIELSDGVNPYSLKNKRNEMQLMKAKTTTNPMKFQNSLIETSPITKMQQQPKQAGNLTKHDQQIEPAHKGNLQDDNLSFQEPTNNQINISLEKMQKDLILMKNSNLHATLTEKQHKTLENILGAFILYRPDIGYIPESMPNLAAALVHHLEDESIVFRSFINLLHSYHFLTFFRGEMSEIKWRVQFFNQHLQHRMPLVLQHFKALDLSSELFLMHWFLNLFTNVFDQETVFRIWDNFLLEGEIYAFKAGIAFIEYFHLEFKMSTFDDAIHLLRNPPQDIFCPDLYFDIIEDIKIPVKEFNDLLNQQNIAKLAPQILQQLL